MTKQEEIRKGLIKFFTPPGTVRQSGTILNGNIKGVVNELLEHLHSQGVVIKITEETKAMGNDIMVKYDRYESLVEEPSGNTDKE